MNLNVKAADFVFQTVTDFSTSVPFYRETLGLDLETIDEDYTSKILLCEIRHTVGTT